MNNLDFINFAIQQLGKPYIFGTYGQKLTKTIIDNSRKLYPTMWNDRRYEKAINCYIGLNTFDCSGLFKAFLMSDGLGNVNYNSHYDLNVQGLFNASNNKLCIGSNNYNELLEKFKTTCGLAICNKKFTHIIYIQDEFTESINKMQTIEAKGFDYGVVNDSLFDVLNKMKDGYIFELPFIDYISRDTIKSFYDEHKQYKLFTSDAIQEIAEKTIKGIYGNGEIRRANFKILGCNYDMIQARVNDILNNRTIKTDKEICEIVKSWDISGYTLEQRIYFTGHDYKYIMMLINKERLKK